jgi:hypothetical protein
LGASSGPDQKGKRIAQSQAKVLLVARHGARLNAGTQAKAVTAAGDSGALGARGILKFGDLSIQPAIATDADLGAVMLTRYGDAVISLREVLNSLLIPSASAS